MNKKLYNKIISGDVHYFYTSWVWRKKRQQLIDEANNECTVCKKEGRVTVGTKDDPLHVHHIKHLKDRPDLALINNNLLVVCKECHEKQHPEVYERKVNEIEIAIPERWE